MDDTAGGDNEDALTDMVFYVPKEAAGFNDGEEEQAAKVHRMLSLPPNLCWMLLWDPSSTSVAIFLASCMRCCTMSWQV